MTETDPDDVGIVVNLVCQGDAHSDDQQMVPAMDAAGDQVIEDEFVRTPDGDIVYECVNGNCANRVAHSFEMNAVTQGNSIPEQWDDTPE